MCVINYNIVKLHELFVGPDSLGVEVVNIDDISQEKDFELGLRIATDAFFPNSTIFYSDLNGFTMHKVS